MTVNTNVEVFAVLKRALKAKGMTYADLAKKLNVSESTIKRLFVDCDCKFSRLIDICHALELSISEVTDVADRSSAAILDLPESVEQALATSPSLFWFYILLRDDMSCEQIEKLYNLDTADGYLYCRDLERLGLISLTSDNRIQQLFSQAIRFSTGGPLHKIYKEVNLKFVARTMDNSIAEPEKFTSISRRMKSESAEQLNKEIRVLEERISSLSRQDKLTSSADDLIAFKWVIAADHAMFASLMTITPHASNKKQASTAVKSR